MHIQLNGAPFELEAGDTIAGLLARLDLSDKRVAVERNGEIAPASARAASLLAEGDRIEIVHFVGGG